MANAEIRVHDTAAVYGVLLADPECRGCGRAATEAHHLVPRGSPHHGDDVAANIVPLCRDCHSGYHGLGYAVRARIGTRLTVENLGYVTGKVGANPAREFLWRKYLVPRDDPRYSP